MYHRFQGMLLKMELRNRGLNCLPEYLTAGTCEEVCFWFYGFQLTDFIPIPWGNKMLPFSFNVVLMHDLHGVACWVSLLLMHNSQNSLLWYIYMSIILVCVCNIHYMDKNMWTRLLFGGTALLIHTHCWYRCLAHHTLMQSPVTNTGSRVGDCMGEAGDLPLDTIMGHHLSNKSGCHNFALSQLSLWSTVN